jgi:hypothetical protein
MRVSELYEQVAGLGFETSLDDGNDRFYQAAGRALLQINALRPRKGVLEISHRTPRNTVQNPSFSPILHEADDIVFEGVGIKAYYFECDGFGMMYVEGMVDGEWAIIGEVELTKSSGFRAYRGFVRRDGKPFDGTVRLRFTGEYVYALRCLAMYSLLYGRDETDIPSFQPFYQYDMKELTSDFLSFATPPIKVEECEHMLNQEYRVEENNVLLLPFGEDGLYRVHYKRQPKPLVNLGAPAEDSAEIDLDEELCAILPLLTAAYVWAEDEPELSEYYLTLYRERAADLESRDRNAAPVVIKNVYGW